MSNDVKGTLTERGARYGAWCDNAALSQSIKCVFGPMERLPAFAREGLTMIGQKIARILNGDPLYADNWHDIAGYATLCEKECQEVKCDPVGVVWAEPPKPKTTFWYLATPYSNYPEG